MAYLDNTVEYGFGRLGSAYLTDGDAFVPPSGKVVVAMTIVIATKFQELDQVNQEDTAYLGTETQVTANGTNADVVPVTELFPAGITMYGRWNKVHLNQGAVIMYFGL
jgi:hypothetical protein